MELAILKGQFVKQLQEREVAHKAAMQAIQSERESHQVRVL